MKHLSGGHRLGDRTGGSLGRSKHSKIARKDSYLAKEVTCRIEPGVPARVTIKIQKR